MNATCEHLQHQQHWAPPYGVSFMQLTSTSEELLWRCSTRAHSSAKLSEVSGFKERNPVRFFNWCLSLVNVISLRFVKFANYLVCHLDFRLVKAQEVQDILLDTQTIAHGNSQKVLGGRHSYCKCTHGGIALASVEMEASEGRGSRFLYVCTTWERCSRIWPTPGEDRIQC